LNQLTEEVVAATPPTTTTVADSSAGKKCKSSQPAIHSDWDFNSDMATFGNEAQMKFFLFALFLQCHPD
jgi:hypothetical protein